MTCLFKTVLTFALLCIIASCTYSQHVPSKSCILLNNKGVEYLQSFPENEDELNKAVTLLKQATQCDSTYAIAYINLTNAYDRKHSYVEEMKAYNKLLMLTDNSPSMLMEKGMLFERMDNIDSAKACYYLTKLGDEKKLVKHPDDISSIEGLILIKALTDGKDEAVKELNEQIKMHPELSLEIIRSVCLLPIL